MHYTHNNKNATFDKLIGFQLAFPLLSNKILTSKNNINPELYGILLAIICSCFNRLHTGHLLDNLTFPKGIK